MHSAARWSLVTLLLLSMVGCAAGPAVVTTPQPSPIAVSASPTPTTTIPEVPNVIRIVTSMALSGPSNGNERLIESIRQRFQEANYQACDGKFTIEHISLDGGNDTGQWTAQNEAANAHQAVNDPNVMIYIGPINTGAAKVSIPILNRGGVVMISPSATWPGLTKTGRGEAGEPDVYYPTGVRNFVRVSPTDDVQATAAAQWAQQLGRKRIMVIYENGAYGRGLTDIFQAESQRLGLSMISVETITERTQNFIPITKSAKDNKVDLIYYAGVSQELSKRLIQNLRVNGYRGDIIGSDILYNNESIAGLGRYAQGLYVTFGGLPPNAMTGKGKDWYDTYHRLYNNEPDGLSALGYEAVSVALAAINKVCAKDRAAIRDAVFSIHNFDGALGNWSFDQNGDTTYQTISGLQVDNRTFHLVTVFNQNQVKGRKQ